MMITNLRWVVHAELRIGVFLYAKLVMWNLHEQPSRKLFIQEMSPNTLPDGLEQA